MPRRLVSLAAAAALTSTIIASVLVGPLATTNAGTQPVPAKLTSVSTTVRTSPEALAAESAGGFIIDPATAWRQHLVFESLASRAAMSSGMWSCIRSAESGGRYDITSGAYGILISTWDAYSSIWSPFGSWSVPGQAPAAIQDLVAYHLYLVGGGYGGWHDRCTGY